MFVRLSYTVSPSPPQQSCKLGSYLSEMLQHFVVVICFALFCDSCWLHVLFTQFELSFHSLVRVRNRTVCRVRLHTNRWLVRVRNHTKRWLVRVRYNIGNWFVDRFVPHFTQYVDRFVSDFTEDVYTVPYLVSVRNQSICWLICHTLHSTLNGLCQKSECIDWFVSVDYFPSAITQYVDLCVWEPTWQ